MHAMFRDAHLDLINRVKKFFLFLHQKIKMLYLADIFRDPPRMFSGYPVFGLICGKVERA
jgi:hypothetical protein